MIRLRGWACVRAGFASVPWWAIAPFLVAGCDTKAAPESSGVATAEQVTAWGEVVGPVPNQATGASIMAITGFYGPNCSQRSGAWALALNGYSFLDGESRLTVVGGDVDCQLWVTEVKAGTPTVARSYRPASALPLTANYAGLRSAFLLNGVGTPRFFSNFRIQPDITFTSDFVVQMVYSDDLNETDLSVETNSVVWSGSAAAAIVSSPTSTLSLSGLNLSVDGKNLVRSATGSALLTQGTVRGGSYAIDLDTLGPNPSYTAIAAAYSTPGRPRVALSGPSQVIPASEFELLGLDLSKPRIRGVVVANSVDGMNAYQLFLVTIRLPAGTGPSAGPALVKLRTANNFALLAASSITLGAGSFVKGNVGLTPMGVTGLTGFGLVLDGSSAFAMSPLVSGRVYSSSYASPTGADLTTAMTDSQSAWAEGAARLKPDYVNLGGGELGGLTLAPGLYNWSTAASVTTSVTLSGGPGDVWILQVGGALNLAAGARVNLVGGAVSKNVFWVTVGAVALGAQAHFEGIVLSQSSISAGAGATVTGRLLGQTSVTVAAGSGVTESLP